MFKSIPMIAIVCCAAFAAVCLAAPVKEEAEVKTGMSDAYRRGIERFGSGAEDVNEQYVPSPKANKPRIYSQYTQKLTALGGGKPHLREQYRQHHYVPQAPSVLPVQHPATPNGKLTPEAAAKIYVPHRPYQFSTDNLY